MGVEAALAALSLGAGLGGTIMNASAQSQQAEASAAAAEAQARALQRKAGEDTAASQREAVSRSKQKDLVLSKQQAMAANSGAGATDPTILQLMEDTAGQGEFNALSALYEGNSRAAASLSQADIETDKARRTRAAIPTLVGATLLNGASTFGKNALGFKF